MKGLIYKFRLSAHDIESGFKDYVDSLLKRRQLSQEIRDGLNLMAQLRQGNTELLNELFPHICSQTSPPTPDKDELKTIVAEAVRTEFNKHSVSNSGYVPPMENNFPLMQPGPKLLAGANIALPPPDDDDIAVNKVVRQVDVSAMMAKVTEMMQ